MANNPNDALLYRLQQMSLNNGNSRSPNSSINLHNTNNPPPPSTNYYTTQQQQQSYMYMPDDAASGIYENVEYTSVTTSQPLVTDLDAIDAQNFESTNAKAQPQLKPSNGNKSSINYQADHENLRYAHTPQPSEMIEPSPIYENLQLVSG